MSVPSNAMLAPRSKLLHIRFNLLYSCGFVVGILWFFSLFIMPVSAAVDVDSCLRSSVEKFKAGDYHAALIDFSKAIDADPKNAMAYQYRGVAKARFGDSKVPSWTSINLLN